VTLPMRHARPRRRGTALAAAGAVVLAGFGAIAVMTTAGNAETTPLPGVPIPAEYSAFLGEAAKSCPAVTSAKLAGHVMEESGFSPSGTNDRNGRGLAGLTDADWKIWQPFSGASPTDPRASILALAHKVCDLAGQVRVAKLVGDPWQLAVGAYHSGIAAVKTAGGVPAAATDYVDRVMRYAAWYALPPGSSPALAPDSALARASATAAPSANPPSPTPTPTPTPAATTAAPTRTPAPAVTSVPAPAPAPASGGALENPEFQACLSATRAMDGTHLSVTTCDASMIQTWQPMPDGTIRSVGLCMDAANAATADFTPVQVAFCSGNPAQLFTLDQQQHLYSPYANKCVNIHFTPEAGTSVVLFSCLNQSNQIWEFKRR
jgi:hypothetical protein